MKLALVALSLLLTLSGCVQYLDPVYQKIDSTLGKYKAVHNQVELGDSKEQVLGLLLPTQSELTSDLTKSADKFIRDGVRVEVHYMRSGWVQDGRSTDDEFTPYIFENGKLVAIGWQPLGGPKILSQTPPSNTTVIQEQSSSTQTTCTSDFMGGMRCQTY